MWQWNNKNDINNISRKGEINPKNKKNPGKDFYYTKTF